MIGSIYKIIHSQSDIVYVGSTFNELKQRWQEHKRTFKRWCEGNGAEISIYPYFREHGIDQFKIILVKEYDVVDRAHLEAYEQLWMSKFHNSAVNKQCAFKIKSLSQKKYYKDNWETKKQYREANKEKELQRAKLYRETNPEKVKERAKQYRESNHEKINNKMGEKHQCDCGGKYTYRHKSNHLKTTKHQNFIKDHPLGPKQ
jgi:hypothetical protein